MESCSISIAVHFFGILERYAGTRSKTVMLPEPGSLQTLLDLLESENPPTYRNLNALKKVEEPFLRVMVNEKLIDPSDYNLALNEDDVVTLLPGISGGSEEK